MTATRLAALAVALLGALAGGCGAPARDHRPAGQEAAPSPGAAAPPAAPSAPSAGLPPAAPPPSAAPEPALSDENDAPPATDEGPLVGEERERDPRSETVTIKVIVDQRRKAHVFWGVKDFGEAPLEIVRPRNSGPLDLVVTAPGYLPLHARAFTDRDDKLALRLYADAEAPQLLGYRPDQEIPQNQRKNGPAARVNEPRKRVDATAGEKK